MSHNVELRCLREKAAQVRTSGGLGASLLAA
jgi:hypothetical protein